MQRHTTALATAVLDWDNSCAGRNEANMAILSAHEARALAYRHGYVQEHLVKVSAAIEEAASMGEFRLVAPISPLALEKVCKELQRRGFFAEEGRDSSHIEIRWDSESIEGEDDSE